MSMAKPVILVDMDDTLNQFAEVFWGVYNDLYNEAQDHRLVNTWDLQLFARGDINVYDLLKHPGIYRDIPLKSYAAEFMRQIHDKYDVYIVTDAPEGTSHCVSDKPFSNPADDKRTWVKEHFPFFPQDRIIICSHKWMVVGDVLIDDKPAIFEKFQELGRKCILIDMPYNQHIKTIWRAKDLVEAEQMIASILAES